MLMFAQERANPRLIGGLLTSVRYRRIRDIDNEAPFFSVTRMNVGMTVSAPQIEVYVGAGRPGPAEIPTWQTRNDFQTR